MNRGDTEVSRRTRVLQDAADTSARRGKGRPRAWECDRAVCADHIELDDKFDAFALVNGERRDDIYLPTYVSAWEDSATGFREDLLLVHLADPESDARIAVAGLFPLRAGLSVSLPIGDLSSDMRPRPVAFTAR